MWFIWGYVVGGVLGRIGVLRAAAVWITLYAIAFVTFQLVSKNVGKDAATVATMAVPIGLFAWALWHPARNAFFLWMVDGAYLGARLGTWGCAAWSVVLLFQADFRIPAWLGPAWPWVAAAGVLWLVQRGLLAQVVRSHRIAAQREAAAQA